MIRLAYLICGAIDKLWPQKGNYGTPVLTYHSISTKPSELSIDPDMFDQQLEWLTVAGYRSVGVDDLFGASDGADPEQKSVLITFDDGFKDSLHTAAPLLAKHGFQATIFVTTGYLGGTSDFCTQESDRTFEMLTKDEVKMLADEGWTVANHFHAHTVLPDLSADELRDDYGQARTILGDELGVSEPYLDIIAYPRGRVNAESTETLDQLGVKLAFKGGKRICTPSDPVLALPRIGISRQTSLAEIKLMLSPTYDRLKRARSAIGRVRRRWRNRG